MELSLWVSLVSPDQVDAACFGCGVAQWDGQEEKGFGFVPSLGPGHHPCVLGSAAPVGVKSQCLHWLCILTLEFMALEQDPGLHWPMGCPPSFLTFLAFGLASSSPKQRACEERAVVVT